LLLQVVLGDEYYKNFTLQSRINYNPHDIDHSCPIYVNAKSSDGGLGDMLEHFVYAANIAKLLQATIVIDGFKEGTNRGHHGSKDYIYVFKLLGILSFRKIAEVHSYYTPGGMFSKHKLTREFWYFPDVLLAQNNSIPVKCHQLIEVDILYCVRKRKYNWRDWCFLLFSDRDWYGEVSGMLRNNTARETCFRNSLGFTRRMFHHPYNHTNRHHNSHRHHLNIHNRTQLQSPSQNHTRVSKSIQLARVV